MTMDRQFLGWDKPCLHAAAAWLRAKYERRGQLDLSRVVIALPGARAGRRLLELLATDHGLIGSPRMVTVGQLPEHLYESAAMRPLADSLSSLLARWHALRSVDRAVLETMTPRPPAESDFAGWLALAREVNHLDDELAAELWSFASVAQREYDTEHLPIDERWSTLARIGDHYHKNLASLGMRDRNAARLTAVADQQCRTECDIVVIGAIDLSRLVRQMLTQVADRVTLLVHAPASESEAFNAWGCAVVDVWAERKIAIDDEAIHVVDTPAEQALEVALVLEGWVQAVSNSESDSEDAKAIDPTNVTVGLGDEALSPAIERVLRLAGLPTHSAVGMPVSQARPTTLLGAVAAFADGLRLDHFASLLRHCDIERYLRQRLVCESRSDGDEASASTIVQHWLTLLDDYISDHLHLQSVSAWLDDSEETARLAQVYDTVRQLLPDTPDTRRTLAAWSETIGELLRAVYGDVPIDEQDAMSMQLVAALQALANLLGQQATWNAGAKGDASAMMPLVTFADAIRFTLSRLGDQAIADAMGDGVEVLGWLELQLDDAEHLVITGMNEGHVPASTHGDALLPNRMRQRLGLMHNDRRTARDTAALTAMLHSRPRVKLIAGRRGADGEPLLPSRLLLRCAADDLPARVQRFYPERRPLKVMPIAWRCAEVNQLLVPAPRPLTEPFTELPVTAFRTYLDCPYRFYLKYVLRLKTAGDEAAELNAAQFGNVMHSVLDAFGKHGPAHSAKLDEVSAFLDATLDARVIKQFGDEPPATVRIQIEQMRFRLTQFARWQVEQVNTGWRMVPAYTEKELRATLDVDDGSIDIVGRIDRIDRHERNKTFRVLDYKTGDSAKTPLQAHCKGVKKRVEKDGDAVRGMEWIDLQLPLYHLLVEQLEIATPRLGYVRLSKDPRQPLLAESDWVGGEIDSAIEQAREVVRRIHTGNFWPPREPAQFEDAFSDLCLERHFGRESVLAQSAPMNAPTQTRSSEADGGGA